MRRNSVNETLEPERMHLEQSAIGGFFELEMQALRGDYPYPGATGFQSARAAFLALLRAGKPKRVWMPYYICGTMLASMRQAGVEPVFYRIDGNLGIAEELAMEDDDWLLYVDYFGVCGEQVMSTLSRFDPTRVVIDSSQSLFSAPRDCLATIYSPRKFLGVPDGGMLVSSLPVAEPAEIDEGAFERAVPLLKRAACSPEAAYAEHCRAELTLFDQEPKRMSSLTRRILSSIDLDKVRRTRNRNFAFLHARLERYNFLKLDLSRLNGPLCYPFLSCYPGLKRFLIGRRIYVPTYWQDVLEFSARPPFEVALVQGLAPLPCDQRYGEPEMERIANACLDYLEEQRATEAEDAVVAGTG